MNDQVQLRPRYILAESECGKEIIVLGGDKVLKISVKNTKVKDWIMSLSSGISVNNLEKVLSVDEVNDLLRMLNEKNLIRNSFSNNYLSTPYEKHIPFFADFCDDPNAMQKQLFSKSVMIVGCGGVGTIVLRHLIALGVNEFHLVDFDKVHESNLNRQFMFDLSDIGSSKTEALKNKIDSLNQETKVYSYDIIVEDSLRLTKEVKRNIDFIVCAADRPPLEIRRNLILSSKYFSCPVIFGGVGIETGSWGPLLVNDLKKDQYLKHLEKTDNFLKVTEIQNIPMSIGYSNSLVSTFLSMDVTKYFIGMEVTSLNKRMQINFNDLKIEVREDFS
jgi:tRNA A37 threonylcarbamoyladenosine dehydratase